MPARNAVAVGVHVAAVTAIEGCNFQTYRAKVSHVPVLARRAELTKRKETGHSLTLRSIVPESIV